MPSKSRIAKKDIRAEVLWMSVESLLEQIKMDTDIWMSPIHGLDHWKRVEAVGLDLAYNCGGDPEIVRYFAILHDCMRENEGHDPHHGLRAAKYAHKHVRHIELSSKQFETLLIACEEHTSAHPTFFTNLCSTLACCWNADRYDLTRLGIVIDESYLFSM